MRWRHLAILFRVLCRVRLTDPITVWVVFEDIVEETFQQAVGWLAAMMRGGRLSSPTGQAHSIQVLKTGQVLVQISVQDSAKATVALFLLMLIPLVTHLQYRIQSHSVLSPPTGSLG